MRILLFTDLNVYGGLERLFVLLARHFRLRGHQVQIVASRIAPDVARSLPPDAQIMNLGADRDLERIAQHMLGDPDRVPELPALRAFFCDARPDVILAAKTVPNLQAIWAVRTAPRFTSRVFAGAHSFPAGHLSVAPQIRQQRARNMTALVQHWFPKADGVIAVSAALASYVQQSSGIDPDRLHVIHNPIDVAAVRQHAGEPLSHAWFAPAAPPVILGIGRLAPDKAFDRLIDAVADLRQSRPVRLILVGDGPDRPSLESQARQLHVADDVLFWGHDPNPWRLMARAAVIAVTSPAEGFSLVAAEALCIGTPIVATDCGGPREVLADGRFGTLVPVGDRAALTGALRRAIDSPPRPPHGIDQHLLRFNIDAVTERYLDLLCPRR